MREGELLDAGEGKVGGLTTGNVRAWGRECARVGKEVCLRGEGNVRTWGRECARVGKGMCARGEGDVRAWGGGCARLGGKGMCARWGRGIARGGKGMCALWGRECLRAGGVQLRALVKGTCARWGRERERAGEGNVRAQEGGMCGRLGGERLGDCDGIVRAIEKGLLLSWRCGKEYPGAAERNVWAHCVGMSGRWRRKYEGLPKPYLLLALKAVTS
ncbi:unnamed protein product [Closterium sp. Naga37s-1]|nr:unnamed protein product [Closterium sp. Naga37s-1]